MCVCAEGDQRMEIGRHALHSRQVTVRSLICQADAERAAFACQVCSEQKRTAVMANISRACSFRLDIPQKLAFKYSGK